MKSKSNKNHKIKFNLCLNKRHLQLLSHIHYDKITLTFFFLFIKNSALFPRFNENGKHGFTILWKIEGWRYISSSNFLVFRDICSILEAIYFDRYLLWCFFLILLNCRVILIGYWRWFLGTGWKKIFYYQRCLSKISLIKASPILTRWLVQVEEPSIAEFIITLTEMRTPFTSCRDAARDIFRIVYLRVKYKY